MKKTKIIVNFLIRMGADFKRKGIFSKPKNFD